MRKEKFLEKHGKQTISGCKFFLDFHSITVIRDEFESSIKQEEQDRILYHDSVLNPFRAQLKGITDGLVKEKKTRIANEKQILAEIAKECN